MELPRYAAELGTVGSGAREHTINAKDVLELIGTPGIALFNEVQRMW
jgi:hypothetical protein